MNINKIKKKFSFPLEEKYQKQIERDLSTYTIKIGKFICFIILIFQTIMMISMLLREGGPFASQRRQLYFQSYIILFGVTLFILISIFYYCHKQIHHDKMVLNIGFIFAAFVCYWSCAVTLLDQLGGSGITVFSYMVLTMAALTILKPWQSILLFGSCFIFLNSSLPLFENGMRNIFSNSMNGSFTTIFAILISCTSYHIRIYSYYNQIIIEHQIQEISEINKRLNHLVMIDELTQLNNRRYLEEIIRKRLEGHREEPQKVTGMMIDIDFFKQYNDTYGHQAGDICLRAISKQILNFISTEDASAVRYGGEEFFVCLFGCNQKQAFQKAQLLRSSIETMHIDRKDIPLGFVTVSIGIYTEEFPGSINFLQFLQYSDEALYLAKKEGRNCVVPYRKK